MFSNVLKRNSLLSFHKSWNSVLSYHLLFVHRSPISFLSFFSPFFARLPPFLLFHKLRQSVFLFFSSAFVLCSRFSLCFELGVVDKDLVRDEALRSVVLNPPPPPPKNVLLNRGWSIRVSGKLFTYPCPKSPLTLNSQLRTKCYVERRGRQAVSYKTKLIRRF